MSEKFRPVTITRRPPTMAQMIVDLKMGMKQVRNVIMLIHNIKANEEFAAIKKEVARLRNKKKS